MKKIYVFAAKDNKYISKGKLVAIMEMSIKHLFGKHRHYGNWCERQDEIKSVTQKSEVIKNKNTKTWQYYRPK